MVAEVVTEQNRSGRGITGFPELPQIPTFGTLLKGYLDSQPLSQAIVARDHIGCSPSYITMLAQDGRDIPSIKYLKAFSGFFRLNTQDEIVFYMSVGRAAPTIRAAYPWLGALAGEAAVLGNSTFSVQTRNDFSDLVTSMVSNWQRQPDESGVREFPPKFSDVYKQFRDGGKKTQRSIAEDAYVGRRYLVSLARDEYTNPSRDFLESLARSMKLNLDGKTRLCVAAEWLPVEFKDVYPWIDTFAQTVEFLNSLLVSPDSKDQFANAVSSIASNWQGSVSPA